MPTYSEDNFGNYQNTQAGINAAVIIPLVINSVTPNQGSKAGKTQIVISGSGLPIKFPDVALIFTSMLGDDQNSVIIDTGVEQIPLQVISSDSYEMIAVIPRIPISQANSNIIASTIKITINGLEQTIPYTYMAALTIEVSDMTPKSASPFSSGQEITITGTNFD